jgi:GH25 family lysozyme M1 (1,4-beta-N-acetylmuramidase)
MRRLHRSWYVSALALVVAVSLVPLSQGGSVDARSPNANPRASHSPKPSATASPSPTKWVSDCSVNLRSSASTSASIVATILTGTTVTVASTVTGGDWSATCATTVSGNTWYVINAVNGTSTSSLYGVSQVYAATGLFHNLTDSKWLEGVDISHWQGTVDFAKVKAAGKTFVIAKATEGGVDASTGTGYQDPNYATYKAGATGAGLAFTGYHYARPDLNPTLAGAVEEADWFATVLGLQHGMLIPALDLEVHGTLGVTDLQNWVLAWLEEVYARTGVRAMIYVSPNFWSTYMGDTPWYSNNGYTLLWVAHWGVDSPHVPGYNWGGKGWTFWQYTSSGSVSGISGSVDLDRYNGTNLAAVTY